MPAVAVYLIKGAPGKGCLWFSIHSLLREHKATTVTFIILALEACIPLESGK